MLYTNANIVTLDPARPRGAALRVVDHRVDRVLDAPPRSDDALEHVDLNGATIVPGLNDAHIHLAALGRSERGVDLRGCRGLVEAMSRVQAHAARHPGREVIVGDGWDQNLWSPPRFPDRSSLDRSFGDRPVVLLRVDHHAAWVNSAALDLADIVPSTEDPPGGRLLRGDDRSPTGILLDTAVELVTRQLPEPEPEQLERDLEAGALRCASLGLTAVHDMGLTTAQVRALTALERRGALPLRVFGYLLEPIPTVQALIEERATGPSGELVELRGIKLYVDGALGSRGAALHSGYTDDPANFGLLLTPPDHLITQVEEIHRAGLQVAVHAIGDRANAIALDAFARLPGGSGARRHRLEHAQILDPQDLPRLSALGVVASMQPTHAVSDMGWVEGRLGAARLEGAYAWRSLLRSGARLAFGSDAPIESPDPRRGLVAAVHGTDLAGCPAGGWRPRECLSRQQAVEAYTIGPAHAVFRETELGVIHEGAWADLTVLDRDPLDPQVTLSEVQVLRTIVGGREVYRAPAEASPSP